MVNNYEKKSDCLHNLYASSISICSNSTGESDQTYAELVPDEQIQLAFILPNNRDKVRTFTLYTKGRYDTIS